MIENVYVEKEALDYPLTREILDKIKCGSVIYVDDANDIFKRPNQNYALQKEHQALILSVNHGNFVYKASDNCQSFGSESFYYCSMSKNCLYACDYCYL